MTMYNLEPVNVNLILERQVRFCQECELQIYCWTSDSQAECWNSFRSLLSLTAFPAPLTTESIAKLPYLHLFLALRQEIIPHIVRAIVGVEAVIEEVIFSFVMLLVSTSGKKNYPCFYSFIYSNYITRHCQEKWYTDKLQMITPVTDDRCTIISSR